jgi:radical SAM superfamily enzyme YgiQ (UPF0313 family)
MNVLLIIYDNESFIQELPIGMAHLAAALYDGGHRVEFYHQDICHHDINHLRRKLNDDAVSYDAVCLSFIGGYWQYRKAMEISEVVTSIGHREYVYIIGGHGPAPEPEYFLRKTGADYLVIGEGERALVELLEHGHEGVDGVAWLDNDNKLHVNNPRKPADIDDLPWPAYYMLPMHIYRLFRMVHSGPTDFCVPMLSSRGCPFRCNFCYRMDKGIRVRDVRDVVEEMRYLSIEHKVNCFAFFDELLMSSKDRAMELSTSIAEKLPHVKWQCNGRLNYAEPDVLAAMRNAGCVFINYGIESVDNQVLERMHKRLDVYQIEHGVQNTLSAGISPGLNIIWGNHGDSLETLQKGVDFLLRYDDGAQKRTIRPVTPYPGSELFYDAVEMGLLDGVADFYENEHRNSDLLTVNFMDLTDRQAHAALHEANSTLLDRYVQRWRSSTDDQLRQLYLEQDASFRGFRHH